MHYLELKAKRSTGCLKKYTDLIGYSDVKLALINGLSLSQSLSIVNLNIGNRYLICW